MALGATPADEAGAQDTVTEYGQTWAELDRDLDDLRGGRHRLQPDRDRADRQRPGRRRAAGWRGQGADDQAATGDVSPGTRVNVAVKPAFGRQRKIGAGIAVWKQAAQIMVAR